MVKLQRAYHLHPDNNRYERSLDRLTADIEDLDEYYVLAKLQLVCELKNRAKIYSDRGLAETIDELMESVENLYLKESNITAKVYQQLLNLFSEEITKSQFEEINQLFRTHIKQIGFSEQQMILQQLINYCIRWIAKDQAYFGRSAFDLYKLGVERTLLLNFGKMSTVRFANIISLGCAVKELDWVENFIKTHSHYLDEKIREETTDLSKAEISFAREQYQEATSLLIHFRASNLLHQIKAKVLNLKCWYEEFRLDTDLFELLFAQIEAFEKYFRRHEKIDESRRKAALNFALMLRNIARYKVEGIPSSTRINKLKQQFRKDSLVLAKDWLGQKIDEL